MNAEHLRLQSMNGRRVQSQRLPAAKAQRCLRVNCVAADSIKEAERTGGQRLRAALSAVAAAAVVGLSGTAAVQPPAAIASEYELLREKVASLPEYYIHDDANVISEKARTSVEKMLRDLEKGTGYRLEPVVIKELVYEYDKVDFIEKLLETWYPTVQQGDKKGIVLIIAGKKEGAWTGGPAFVSAVGEPLLNSVANENIKTFASLGKVDQALISSVERIAAKLYKQPDPGAPLPDGSPKLSAPKPKSMAEADEEKKVTAIVAGAVGFAAAAVPCIFLLWPRSKAGKPALEAPAVEAIAKQSEPARVTANTLE